ncbi:bifunctional aminoglycoside phosphotransferase/ATP-binding protein [Roseovarius salis]|uniref:bifunctional aminoglycoside phosphotransferase/ATP-binding protein n=1 Tax=Roseovarius salis TaxID=3376063 RepID=UPI0037C99E04
MTGAQDGPPPFEDIVALLSDPATHAADGPVEMHRTHAAIVFLVGRDAYKVKRPVRYDYLDFSTPEKRRAMLRHEFDLNASAAPGIYLGLVAVTRDADGRLALDGDGEPVEWCLHMRRFPQGAELSAVAARGALTTRLAEDIGTTVADLHARAEPRAEDGQALVRDIATELDGAFAGMTDILPAGDIARFNDLVAARVDATGALLATRGRAGHVRRGHGDLHMGNMVVLDGRPVPFDALEFDERLGTLDVLYDLAFLLMDMLHRGLDNAANAVLGAWLRRMDDVAHLDGLAALPLFLGLRAGIRAMVSVQSARMEGEDAAAKTREARGYLAQALDHLDPPAPRLVAVGGFSGTGKTTLARHLAPGIGAAPGAVHLRSDIERKTLYGVDPLTALPPEAYSAEASERVYSVLRDKAMRLLLAGHSAVLDAVFDRQDERDRVRELAERAGVPMTGLWLTAREEVLVERVSSRSGDASDADAAVVRQQLETGDTARGWTAIDAGGPASATLEQARAATGAQRPDIGHAGDEDAETTESGGGTRNSP